MGKNLKGKECGKGICQRKDGLYAVDFENRALTSNKTLAFRYTTQTWRAGPSKTQQLYRTTPLQYNNFSKENETYMKLGIGAETTDSIFQYISLNADTA